MKTFMRIVEQADFDHAEHDPSELHTFDKQEFSTPGKADLKVRPNDPRFGDNPMKDARVDEFAGDTTIDRLHQMLSNIPITDQQIKGGVSLTAAGKAKVAARLGIGPDDVDMYINSLVQRLNDQENESQEDVLTEQYY